MKRAPSSGTNPLDWHTVLAAIPNPAYVHGPDGRLIAANDGFLRMMRLQSDPFGTPCTDLIHWGAGGACPACDASGQGAPVRGELRMPGIGIFCIAMTSLAAGPDGAAVTVHSFTDASSIRDAAASSLKTAEHAQAVLRGRERELRDSRDAFFNMLEDISESYAELEDLFMNLLKAMVGALDAKSPWTRGHSERVARLTGTVARAMGLEEDIIRDLHLGGLLHDIGKIGTYDHLLEKPGPLTPEEYEIMKKHPAQGAEIIQNIKQLRNIVPYIRHHHERYDGRGYPDGLKGEEIPLPARILHAADSFDAMTASRPYREAPGVAFAMKELERYAGVQFDPDVAHAFMALYEKQPELFL